MRGVAWGPCKVREALQSTERMGSVGLEGRAPSKRRCSVSSAGYPRERQIVRCEGEGREPAGMAPERDVEYVRALWRDAAPDVIQQEGWSKARK